MVQISDLRIGNLVNFIGGDLLSPIDNCTIALISLRGSVEISDGKNNIATHISRLVPIPFTVEWLIEKAGFVRNHMNENIIFISLDKTKYEYRFNTKYNVWVVFGMKKVHDDNLVIELRFIHQLQNLYYALEGEELELK